jgi:hypothetical protein
MDGGARSGGRRPRSLNRNGPQRREIQKGGGLDIDALVGARHRYALLISFPIASLEPGRGAKSLPAGSDTPGVKADEDGD